MKLFILIFVTIFISACGEAPSVANDQGHLLIRTVDKNGQPMKVEMVRWWFSANPEITTTLSCEKAECVEWSIKGTFTKPVTVYAHASLVQAEDQECWDFYEGEAGIQPQQKEAILTLLYKATACK